jgi:hypothetical protein
MRESRRVTKRATNCIATTFAFIGALASPVLAAGTSRSYGEGGRIAAYLPIIAGYNESGEPFRIEGECKSACTLFLGIRNVCVERSAVLMFHAGHDIRANVTGPDTRASHIILNAYNARLRAYLLSAHYMDTSEFHTLAGSVLIEQFGYQECPAQ